MIIVDPSFSKLPISKQGGKWPSMYEFHQCLIDANAFTAALVGRAQRLAGSDEKSVFLSYMTQALGELCKDAAEAVASKIVTAYRGQNIPMVKIKKAVKQGRVVTVDDWLAVHLAGPTLGVPFAMTTAVGRATTRRAYPISSAAAIVDIATEVAAGGIAYVCPVTSLLSSYASIWITTKHRLSTNQQTQLEDLQQQVQQLLDSTPWVDALKPIDFIAFTDDGVTIPRTWTDSVYGVLPGVTRVSPASSPVHGVVASLESDATAVTNMMALKAGLTTSEIAEVREGARQSLNLTDGDTWTTLPYPDWAEEVLDGPVASYLVEQPSAWLALVPELLRTCEGAIAYTPDSYASTVLKLTQCCNAALGMTRWTSNWSTKVAANPMTLDELHAAFSRAGSTSALSPAEADGAVGWLLSVGRGDIKWSVESASGQISPANWRVIDLWLEEPIPVLSNLVSALGATVSSADHRRWTLQWNDGSAKQLQLSATQYAGRGFTEAVWAAVSSNTTAQAARAFEAFLLERRVMTFLLAVSAARGSDDLIVDATTRTLRVQTASALLLSSRSIAVQSGDATLASPFLLNRDSPEV